MSKDMDSKYRSCASIAPSSLAMDDVVTLLVKSGGLSGKGPLATAVMLIALSRRLTRTDHLLLLPKTLKEFGLSRSSAYRGLAKMERLGLIEVQRRRGEGPLVTLTVANSDDLSVAR